MRIDFEVNPRFENFLFDWNYKTYLLLGGYGSSKSYHIALKIILKCLAEKRKVLVVREVYETIRESTFDLFEEILEKMNLLSEGRDRRGRVVSKTSPMSFKFPNGSKIIFKGLDKVAKLKSINGVSIIWIEEASEIKYDGYKELQGRLRHTSDSMHMILSWNPTDEQNWTYKRFFMDKEKDKTFLEPRKLYAKKTLVRKNVYYHHSLPDDNLFLPREYLESLEELKEYDLDLWRVARKGEYGPNGTKVLTTLSRMGHTDVMRLVGGISEDFKFNGMDFGFEKSYNALIRLAVDDANKILYVYHEYYKNQITDDQTAKEIEYMKDYEVSADNEDPKAIRFYQLSGFRFRKCHKTTRLSQVRKMKRFKSIVISDDCPHCWDELKDLTYKVDRNGDLVYDEFNIDPHTFSAMWYALDNYHVADLKELQTNSRKGS